MPYHRWHPPTGGSDENGAGPESDDELALLDDLRAALRGYDPTPSTVIEYSKSIYSLLFDGPSVD